MLIFNELNSALYAPIPKDIYTASLIINKNGCCFMQLLDFTIYQHKPFILHLSLGIPCVYRGFRG